MADSDQMPQGATLTAVGFLVVVRFAAEHLCRGSARARAKVTPRRMRATGRAAMQWRCAGGRGRRIVSGWGGWRDGGNGSSGAHTQPAGAHLSREKEGCTSRDDEESSCLRVSHMVAVVLFCCARACVRAFGGGAASVCLYFVHLEKKGNPALQSRREVTGGGPTKTRRRPLALKS